MKRVRRNEDLEISLRGNLSRSTVDSKQVLNFYLFVYHKSIAYLLISL